MTDQFEIKLNEKYRDLFIEFKTEITKLEGGYYGFLGDYVAEAVDFYMQHMKHFPEKIGKERKSVSNLSKIQQKANSFIENFGDALKPISQQGLDHDIFERYLKTFFKKSDRTLRDYKKEILMMCQWSVINISGTRKKIVLHRNSNLYELVKRFDETLNYYHSGLRPRKEEAEIMQQIKGRFIPKGTSYEELTQVQKEADAVLGGGSDDN